MEVSGKWEKVLYKYGKKKSETETWDWENGGKRNGGAGKPTDSTW